MPRLSVARPRLSYLAPALLLCALILQGCDSSRPDTGGEASRIFNGTVLDEAAAPNVVRVRTALPDGSETACSGAVIGTNAVLTAAHCVEGGRTIVDSVSGSFTAAEVHLAPGYRIDTALGVYFNDVAVIVTKLPLAVPPLPIVAGSPVQPGSTADVYGFGIDENGRAGELRSGRTQIQSVSDNHLFGEPFDGRNINPCRGDSGGPLITAVAESGALGIAGLVSGGTVAGCATGDTTIYANLQTPGIIEFILKIVPEAALI